LLYKHHPVVHGWTLVYRSPSQENGGNVNKC
jgi:hypothetical protein